MSEAVPCAVIGATHVKVGGRVERIIGTWGINAEGRFAKPSEGGFGVITESGFRVSMMEAEAYYREAPPPPPVFTLRLSSIQLVALRGMLIEYVRAANAPGSDKAIEWADALSHQKATLEEIFTFIQNAQADPAAEAARVLLSTGLL